MNEFHPRELTRDAVEKWLENFKKKLKRMTSRDDLDRLILSVERYEFEDELCAEWWEVIFENGKAKVSGKHRYDSYEECKISSFQKMLLVKNSQFEGRKIQRSELKEETGEWILDESLKQKMISSGGEAIVLEEKFGELEVSVRVQAFDSKLFSKDDEELAFLIHLSKDYEIAQNNRRDDAPVIPVHPNVIKNFCNIEIFSSEDEKREDCLGLITIMEKCDTDLRSRLKKEDLSLEERKRIANEVREGEEYLKDIGILHYDKKPENILLKNGECKWIDFGTIEERTGRESYLRMGFARRGSKYRSHQYLYAGSAAFSESSQLYGEIGGDASPLHILILCDWKTAWSLLFNPVEEDEREKIKEELKSCNAEWLSIKTPSTEEIENLSKTISLKNAPSDFCLDDPNLTKSSALANLKQKLTRQINFDFENVTKNVLNQKESDLCVPISVSVLLRWAIKNDLKVVDLEIEYFFTLEKIFTFLTMVIYPRSLAGFNLNPKKEEQEFQENEIELLLRRMKFETYLNESGWEIIKGVRVNGDFNFEKVLLHHNFAFSRPLTVTGCYQNPDGSVIFHQMVLDRIENSEFILQNTLIAHSGSQIKIPLSREFYAEYHFMEDCYNCYNDFVYYGDNNEFLTLTNEQFGMTEETWYLLPHAYSIILTPAEEDSSDSSEASSSESSDSENKVYSV